MKIGAALLATMLLAGSSISFFKYQRPVQVTAAGQHYFTVDEAVWKNARRDLGDLRLYNGQAETPYALVFELGRLEHEQRNVQVIQQATVAGKTQFIIDMAGTVQYDHIELDLAAKNFVAHAKVEGQDDLHGPHWALVAEPILYDLSKEGLGGNRMLRLPVSTYKYLRVTIDGPVKPEDVVGASSEFRQEQQAAWRDVSTSPKAQVRDHDSVLTFSLPQNVPAERVQFAIDPAQVNFRREVDIEDERGFRVGSGEISQVRMVRNGNKIDTSNLEVSFSARGDKPLTVIIHNGDDQPLQQHAILQQYERRIYFDSSAAPLTLYYGDEKLDPPIYDYAKLFQVETNAAAAQMGAEQTNASYSGRPDERPWTERHPVVLWIAILAAVAVLGTVALRSMKTAAAS